MEQEVTVEVLRPRTAKNTIAHGLVTVKRTGKTYWFYAWRDADDVKRTTLYAKVGDLAGPKVPSTSLRDARAYIVRDALKD